MVQNRKISSHCCSDRLTVTVVATVAVTAAVTVIVTAAVTATAMDTQIYREEKMIGAAATSPPTAGGGTCWDSRMPRPLCRKCKCTVFF